MFYPKKMFYFDLGDLQDYTRYNIIIFRVFYVHMPVYTRVKKLEEMKWKKFN